MYEKMTDFVAEYGRKYGKKYEKEAENAYNVFRSASENKNKFCLMGRLEDRDKIIGTKEIKSGSSYLLGNDKWANFEVTSTDQSGNVLKLNDQTWTIGVNDAWVLGGIDGRSTFNFFGEIAFDPKKIDEFVRHSLSAKGKYPMTVTAREIYGLRCTGFYEPRYGTDGSLLFIPRGGTARSLTLTQYKDWIDQLDTGREIEALKDWLATAKPL